MPLADATLAWLLVVVIALKLVLALTYPLNIGGDGSSYNRGIIEWKSSLIHPHGYPFITGLFYHGINKTRHVFDQEKEEANRPYPIKISRTFILFLQQELEHNKSFGRDFIEKLSFHLGRTYSAGHLFDQLNRQLNGRLTNADKDIFLKTVSFWSGYRDKWINTRILVFFQGLLDILALVALFFLLYAIFGQAVALIGVALYGLDLRLIAGFTASRPEWIQADFLIFFLALVYLAWISREMKWKILFYSFSGVSFGLCFLIKTYALPFVLIYFVLFFAESGEIKKRVICLAAPFLGILAAVAVYIVSFHYPGCGTSRLELPMIWNLKKNLPVSDLVRPENGISSKRLLLFANRFTRQEFGDSLPDWNEAYRYGDHELIKVRNRYLDRYNWIMQAGEPQIDRQLENCEYEILDYDEHTLVYLFGMNKMNKLAMQVFFEAVVSHPVVYIKRVLSNFFSSVVAQNEALPIPIMRNLGWKELSPPQGIEMTVSEADKLKGGFYYAHLNRNFSRAVRYYNPVILWRPGVIVSSLLAHLRLHILLKWTLVFILVLMALFSYRAAGTWNATTAVPLMLTITMLFFLFFTNLYYNGVGWKQLRLLQPILCSLSAVSLVELFKIVRDRFHSGGQAGMNGPGRESESAG